ncbi:MAG: hypothetical protein ACTHMI_09075 [Mucilaginibacter sp.]
MNYKLKSYLKYLLFAFVFFTSTLTYAQMDTVVLNNQRIACSVKEVTPEAVKYSFPGEDVINSVYKNTVQKIIFKSGRVQTFAESTSYKEVKGVMEYEKVTITSVESEVKGLYKLSDVSSKAKGTTVYSNQERVKDRAYRKIKIQAAMFGANIIYLTNQRTEGNKYGTYFTAGSTAETNLTGVAYSNVLPDIEKFKKIIGDRTSFMAVERFQLRASDSDVSDDKVSKPFTIKNITSDNGIIFIEGELKTEKNVFTFQVANFDNSGFSIAYKYKGDAFNFSIAL